MYVDILPLNLKKRLLRHETNSHPNNAAPKYTPDAGKRCWAGFILRGNNDGGDEGIRKGMGGD